MKIVIINKSDARGGAAVVSRRLMHALRDRGMDATMLVTEKLTADEHVYPAATPGRARLPFIAERLQIFLQNGRNRKDLFKVDTASFGLPLASHPLVKGADAVILGWVNQGMLSLKEIEKIAGDKPVLWTMHDMWCCTALCHHAADCEGFKGECGLCPLLGRKASPRDLSHKTWLRKQRFVEKTNISYVAVSNWLRGRCRASKLLAEARVEVIPNPFKLRKMPLIKRSMSEITVIIAAARLDDPVKGLPIFIDMAARLRLDYPQVAERLHFLAVGGLKDAHALDSFPLPIKLTGMLPEAKIAELYKQAHIVLSSSLYETLPGTLIEGQAAGCLPVAFNRGGQPDIITDGVTGILAPFGNDPAAALAAALARAVSLVDKTPQAELQARLQRSVEAKFSAESVADRYISLIKSMK